MHRGGEHYLDNQRGGGGERQLVADRRAHGGGADVQMIVTGRYCGGWTTGVDPA